MSWAKFDDRYDDHEKVKAAWRASGHAAALHAHAITYSARHETDGYVSAAWIQERFDIARLKDRERRTAMDALTSTGLLEPVDGERFLVHDYLDYNPSRAQLEDRRRRDSERKRQRNPDGIRSDSTGSPNGIHSESDWNPLGIHADSNDASRAPAGAHAARPVPSRPDPEQHG